MSRVRTDGAASDFTMEISTFGPGGPEVPTATAIGPARPDCADRTVDATLEPRPTAVFAVNDNTAVGALSAFEHLGLSVPKDVSLVGYNDIPIVSHLPTPLTSVRVPLDQIAAAALELLISVPPHEHDRVRGRRRP
jgi:DNA-binding LacI/PurR family transcriptional regulator